MGDLFEKNPNDTEKDISLSGKRKLAQLRKDIEQTSPAKTGDLELSLYDYSTYRTSKLVVKNFPKFDPRKIEQFDVRNISQETLNKLKEKRVYLLEQLGLFLSDNYVGGGERLTAKTKQEFARNFFFRPTGGDGGTSSNIIDMFYGWDFLDNSNSLYNKILEFNHSTQTLKGKGIEPISLNSKAIGELINKKLVEGYVGDLPLSIEAVDTFVREHNPYESIPKKNSERYFEIIGVELTEKEYLTVEIDAVEKLINNLPEEVRKYISFDFKKYKEQIKKFQDFIVKKVFLGKDEKGEFAGVKFDGKLTSTEVKIGQYAIRQSGVDKKLQDEIKLLKKMDPEGNEELEELVKKSGGKTKIIEALIKHPNKKILEILENNLEGVENTIDGDFGNITFLFVAAYQIQAFGSDYTKVSGRLDKNTLLHMMQLLNKN